MAFFPGSRALVARLQPVGVIAAIIVCAANVACAGSRACAPAEHTVDQRARRSSVDRRHPSSRWVLPTTAYARHEADVQVDPAKKEAGQAAADHAAHLL